MGVACERWQQYFTSPPLRHWPPSTGAPPEEGWQSKPTEDSSTLQCRRVPALVFSRGFALSSSLLFYSHLAYRMPGLRGVAGGITGLHDRRENRSMAFLFFFLSESL